MAEYKVTCVTTQYKSDTGITHIGSGSMRWTTAKAISEIRSGTTQFYTEVSSVKAQVLVRGTPPNEYLTTASDETKKNNLLELPSC